MIHHEAWYRKSDFGGLSDQLQRLEAQIAQRFQETHVIGGPTGTIDHDAVETVRRLADRLGVTTRLKFFVDGLEVHGAARAAFKRLVAEREPALDGIRVVVNDVYLTHINQRPFYPAQDLALGLDLFPVFKKPVIVSAILMGKSDPNDFTVHQDSPSYEDMDYDSRRDAEAVFHEDAERERIHQARMGFERRARAALAALGEVLSLDPADSDDAPDWETGGEVVIPVSIEILPEWVGRVFLL